MPVHDWKRVAAGIFHDFNIEWLTTIKHALNRELKGTDYYALAEQIAGDSGPDVLTLQTRNGMPPGKARRRSKASGRRSSGTQTLATAPPKARFRASDPPSWYASTKKSVVIHHVSGHHVVAVAEIVSSGNKSSQDALEAFERKARDFLRAGVHMSFVDLYAPTQRDPHGLHPVVWGDDPGDPFKFDPKHPLTVAAYVGGPFAQAFVTPVAVGDKLPDLPLFLTSCEYISVPLERTYKEAFDAVPEYWQDVLTRKTRR